MTNNVDNRKGYIFSREEDGYCLLLYSGLDSVLTLPENYNGESYRIGECAFFANKKIASVVIPNGVVAIGAHAFTSCTALRSITLGTGITEISDCAFDNCTGIIEVVNNSPLDIRLGSEDNGLIAYHAKDIRSGESRLTEHEGFLFYPSNTEYGIVGYTGTLRHLTLPDAFCGEPYPILPRAFSCHEFLRGVTLGNGVTEIGESAFADCLLLEEVRLGNNTSTIGSRAFETCMSLERVILPESLRVIGSNAFSGCTCLTDIYYTGDEESFAGLEIGDGNHFLLSATIHYNYSEQ